MSLALDQDTRTHPNRIRTGIGREFQHIPQEEVDARFEAIVTELLSDATFPRRRRVDHSDRITRSL
jgi:hypothetical protein